MRIRPPHLLLIGYCLLAFLYSIVTPLFEASDELWHYPMVRYLAQHSLALPYQQAGVETAWRQEGSQPPLYYMLAAALTAGIDTADFDALRRINPHADIGAVVPDGNANMTIHDPAVRGFPPHGTALAVYLARWLSVALGAVTVWMTWRLAKVLFPGAPAWLPLAAMAFTAFNPMFLFIAGSVNNDNLSNALASALLVQIALLLRRDDRPPHRVLIGIGVLAGAGMLAKFNIGFLLPIIGLALALLAYRLRNIRFFLTAGLITGGLTVLIGGWWYVRNFQLYGDPTGLNVFLDIVGRRTIPANVAQLWAERHTFLMSYWGFFGGVNVPFPEWFYSLFNGLLAIAALGLIAGGIAWLRSGAFRTLRGPAIRLWLARGVAALWTLILFGGLLRWTSETWASQGRLMFAAIAPISVGMAAGYWALGRFLPVIRWRLAGIAVWWFVLAAAGGLLVIGRAYADPYVIDDIPYHYTALPEMYNTARFYEPGSNQPSLEMRYTGDFHAVHGGEYVDFCVAFAFRPAYRFTRDWSLFVHLETADGVIVAQRDVYPGQGLLATRLMQAEMPRTWCNRVAVRVPEYTFIPPALGPQGSNLRILIGYYDLKTGERMNIRVSRPFNADLEDTRVQVGTARLDPPQAGPNTVNVDLGGEIRLKRYTIEPVSLVRKPGEALVVRLDWEPLRDLNTDYRIFVQIVAPNTTRVFAQGDGMPANWTRPTSGWNPGETIADSHTLTINADAPPGQWQLIVGAYEYVETPAGPQFRRLRILRPDGSQAEDFIALTRVRIAAP